MTASQNGHWKQTVFSEIVAHSAFGPRFSGSAYSEDGNIATLRTTDLDDDGRIAYETMPLAQLDEDKFSNHLLEVGDLVITRSGTCGIAAVFEGFNLPVLPGAFLIRFRLNENAESRFYSYYFNSPVGRTNILSVARGAVQQNLNITNVENLRVPLPPIAQQRLIVEILSGYDNLIENNRRRMALLEDAARQLYREWFVRLRFPGHEHTPITKGVPDGWEKGCFADFYDTSSGGTPSRKRPEFFTGEIPWVKTQELPNGFITDTEEKITEEALGKSSAKLFPERTVLIALYGATVGELGILALPAATNQACCAVFPKHPSAHYIHAFLFFRENKEKLVNLSAGAAQNNISQQIVRAYEMVMPIKTLMETFVESLTPAFDQWLNLQRQNQRLKAARDVLLPRLMSGEIAV